MTDGSERPPIRVLLAVGNPERERRLRDALSRDGLVVAGRCLDGPSLVEQAARPDVDVALASSDLHRLSAATLTALLEARLPVVLLAESVEIEKYRGLAHLLPAASADAEVATALRQALVRGVNYGPSPEAGRSEGSGDGVAESENPGGRVIAVVSGKGAAIVAAMTAGSFLVLLGKLYVSPGSLLPTPTFTSFVILFGVNLFYAALGLGTGFLLLSRLKGKTRRRYWRVQAGLTIMAVRYLSAMLRRIAAFPFPFIVVVLLAYNLGAVVLCLGLIRREGYTTASPEDGVPPGDP